MGSYEPNPASVQDFPHIDAQLEIEGSHEPQSTLEPLPWFQGIIDRPPRPKVPKYVAPLMPDINGNPSYDSSLTLPSPKRSKFCMGTSAFTRRSEEMATQTPSCKLLACGCCISFINSWSSLLFVGSKSTSHVTVEEMLPEPQIDPLAGTGSSSNCAEERSNRSDDLLTTGPFSMPPPISRTKNVRPNVRHKKIGTDDEVVYLGQATAKMSLTRRFAELQEVLDRRHEQLISEIVATRTHVLRMFAALIPEIPEPQTPPPLTTPSRVRRFLERVGIPCDCLNL